MSRIAKKPILIPKGIKVNIINNKIIILKDNLIIENIIHFSILIIIKNNKIILKNNNNNDKYSMYAGTTRSIINNILLGLENNFKKKLLLIGIGYKAYIKNNILFLNLGYSYTIKYIIPDYVNIKCLNNKIIIKGYDKQKVGQVAAKIRSFRPPECYKEGKGIRYYNEFIRIKEHKKKISK